MSQCVVGIGSSGLFEEIPRSGSVENAEFLKSFGVEARSLRIRRNGRTHAACIGIRDVPNAKLASQIAPRARHKVEQFTLFSSFRNDPDRLTGTRVLQTHIHA